MPKKKSRSGLSSSMMASSAPSRSLTVSLGSSAPPLLNSPTPVVRTTDKSGWLTAEEMFANRSPKPDKLDEKSLLFEERDTHENIIQGVDSNNKICIQGATVAKLIQRLTYDKYPDPAFVKTFLLTYRAFCTPDELMEWLMCRFDTPGLNGMDKETYVKTKQVQIRLRVFNVLKSWVDQYYWDFLEHPDIVEKLLKFIDDIFEAENMATAGAHLKRLLDRRASKTEIEFKFQFSSVPPDPILPQGRTNSFMALHPLEVARQLTIMEESLYRKIAPRECIGLAWTKEDKEESAPNIMKCINRFNVMSKWVVFEIVSEGDLKRRAVILSRFITLGQNCLQLNNFNSVMEILSGLQNSSVFRLKKTWALLPKETWDQYEHMVNLMSCNENFKVFRAQLRACTPPCLPYLGIFLTDLTFIHQGNSDHYNKSEDLINFTKLQYISNVIEDIQTYQYTPYCLKPVNSIQEHILSRFENFATEKELYSLSLLCEAKVKKPSSADGKK
eukprot:TRINITY_DN5837_c0_g1_i3.p1 TRINITY_DN5837_c0_g1~~TRINITY_DN5837_c0_g1_i3.p1  ORF type:complete len:500 (-),score=61.99 TRINITY_DN5837_c0_g1_i3:113-1612(-)